APATLRYGLRGLPRRCLDATSHSARAVDENESMRGLPPGAPGFGFLHDVPRTQPVRSGSNAVRIGTVQSDGKKLVLICLTPLLLASVASDATSARRKIGLIESEQLKPGAKVEITLAELNAVATEDSAAIPGVRNPRLKLGPQQAIGEALIDFGKVRRA